MNKIIARHTGLDAGIQSRREGKLVNTNESNPSPGFGLIEVLVALAIMSIALLGSFKLIWQGQQAVNQLQNEYQQQQLLSAVYELTWQALAQKRACTNCPALLDEFNQQFAPTKLTLSSVNANTSSLEICDATQLCTTITVQA